MYEEIIQHLPIDQIISQPQVRREFNSEKLAELAQTITEDGVQQPIRARRDGDQYVIVIGERRWRAAKLAGLKTVPVIVVDLDMTAAEILQAQLVENVQREDLNPIELANAIDQLMKESGCTAADAAKMIGKSPAMVSKLLTILGGSDELKAKVASHEIGVKEGYDLVRRSAAIKSQASPERPRRLQKLTILLGPAQKITLEGIDSTMDACMGALKTVLTRLVAANKQHMELPTALEMFRDQADH